MKKRGSQIYPTQQRRAELARMLNEMASAGDVNAAGWLLLLSEIKQPKSETTQ
ncbi:MULTISPECIES: hypothetical protein [Halomonadaceae]|jgi:hypothetical protein|uniref:hypothetical protein n=1 Tax=Vreelandella TaxID=3137766 RepID=UPI0020A6AA44|nr:MULTISPECIES: hypothetical protein [Halomonas]MDW0358978.1 hypothetical protein [Halomonas venusta]UTD57276.1 hypothetical protein NF683_08690 [Halomonas sp. MS1]